MLKIFKNVNIFSYLKLEFNCSLNSLFSGFCKITTQDSNSDDSENASI